MTTSMHFNFAASTHFSFNSLHSIESFVDNYPDFQTVWLTDENELLLLLDLMGIQEVIGVDLNNAAFSKYWDLSNFRLPELTTTQFDKFYDDWILRTNRENSMNEYGGLLFLQGLSAVWNRLKYRFIVKETTEGL
jgi:hypothetical protein